MFCKGELDRRRYASSISFYSETWSTNAAMGIRSYTVYMTNTCPIGTYSVPHNLWECTHRISPAQGWSPDVANPSILDVEVMVASKLHAHYNRGISKEADFEDLRWLTQRFGDAIRRKKYLYHADHVKYYCETAATIDKEWQLFISFVFMSGYDNGQMSHCREDEMASLTTMEIRKIFHLAGMLGF